ncbi:ABC transporter ATP-binding protein [Paenibacillus ginsengihumi]|uniref:ABC transporter ATP-binding protein n=1 Tax=Paenibacillus ginsengihumi TaxID=431596 RepID=UPI000363A78F|nr:ABC transporter ATP-binding protein [Paenibacillus ginsengihumi]
MAEAAQEVRQRAKIGATVLSAFKLAKETASLKEIVLTYIGLASGVIGTLVAIFEKNFFNEAAKVVTGGMGPSFAQAVQWLALWMGLVLLTNLIQVVSGRASNALWSKMRCCIQENLMLKLSRIRLHYFSRTETYQKFEWVKNELNEKLPLILNAAFGIVFSLIQLITAVMIIGYEHWLIALVVFLGCIPAIILKQRHTEADYRHQQYNSHELRYQTYVSWVMFKRPFMKEMRYGNLYDYVKKKYEDSVTDLYNKRIRLIKRFTLFNGGAQLISLSTIGIALAIIAYEIYRGDAGIGSFVLVYSTAKVMQTAFQGMFEHAVLIGSDGRFLDDYNQLMKYEEDDSDRGEGEELQIKGGAVRKPSPLADAPSRIDMEFHKVSFAYPETDRQVLRDVNVRIRQGEKIAIVGENGSGKSTFISLLCGMYAPTEGRVLLNDADACEQRETIQRTVSCTLQMFGKYEISIADNIRIGDLFREYSDEEIAEAAKLAGAYEFISRLKDGMHTYAGNHYKGGVELSGGQWQKIAIARAILKKDARILIMDEPTAALDPVAEAQLYEDFHRITGDKTTILISHRLGATRLADRILVFSQGRIAEEGSHDELMALDGIYAEMYRAQSQWYVA